MMGNFWAWVWICVFLGTREFLCLEKDVGLEGHALPPNTGYPIIKNLFPSPPILMLCLYTEAGGQTPSRSFTHTHTHTHTMKVECDRWQGKGLVTGTMSYGAF